MSSQANILVGPKCARLKDFTGPYGTFIFGPHIASTPKKPRDREKEFCNLPRWQAYALSIIHQIHAVHHQPRNQVCGLFMVERATEVKPHFRWGPGSKFLGTKLKLFEANWILELDPSLHLGSPNHVLWALFLGLNRLIFLPNWWPCRFSLLATFWSWTFI
jgi:hypothetical protein